MKSLPVHIAAHMGLVLKHVEPTKAGSWQYRRRVPKDIAGIIAKREFQRKLRETERAALSAYPQYHAQVEREIAKARREVALGSTAGTEREAYKAAQRYAPDSSPPDDDSCDGHGRGEVDGELVVSGRDAPPVL